MPMQNACHGCVHHRTIAWTTHLACHHPATERAHRLAVAPVIEIIGDALPLEIPGLVAEFHHHGVSHGWASWPYNFDPVWLVRCDGYAPAEEAA